MYKILIVDDEPLVQIGLRTMFSTGFDDIEIAGTCSNGKEALDFMECNLPDIVIADIKMPIMSGLELLGESSRRYGLVPAFILLTAYEEFDLARQALSLQAVDYLVKIELSRDTLKEAVRKAMIRVNEHSSALSGRQEHPASPIDEYRQKFFLRIFSHMIPDKETLLQQAADLHLNMDYSRFIVVYAQIYECTPGFDQADEKSRTKLINLYSSCADMSKEIISRYAPCYFTVPDMKHFAAIFYFDTEEPVADMNAQIQDALMNVNTMISNYFNAQIRFGIGTAVTDPMNIAASYEEAKTAQSYTDDNTPVHLFSHIVGANRRSGKDKLILAVQEYIDKNLDGHLQLSEIADVFGLSPAYLSVLFKKNADIGFSEYVNSKKIEKAKEMLLSGDMKIYEVADALGFESAYYFSKVFKKVDGHSPREYIQSKTDDAEDGNPDPEN